MNNEDFKLKQESNEKKGKGAKRFEILLLSLFLAALTVLVINI